MAVRPVPIQTDAAVTNGSAMAAFLGAGVGAFAIGLLVLLNEAGIFVAPTLYGPAGGVSGRTTFAMLVWLISWGLLHSLWKTREMASGRVYALTLLLAGFGVLGTFPPLWGWL